MTFHKINSVSYPDQHCSMDEYVHEKTGFRHYHLNSSFPELVFALSVPTPAEDDTGMPHILEHFTLSGGRKFPLKDPFFAMSNRSVAHQMNAETAWLHTTYFFATTLQQDFANLSDVYLDSVFNPLLRPQDFEQEGWRLEKSEDNTWSLKGVVLNEMKGVYADPSSSVYDHLLNILAPDTPLSRLSGGHPVNIPYLEYPRLLDFHRRYYTPKKAVLATSGELDIATLHQQIEEALADHLAHAQEPLETPVPPPAGALLPSTYKKDGNIWTTDIPGDDNNAPLILMAYTKPRPHGGREELWDGLMAMALFDSASSPLRPLEQKWQCSINSWYFFDPVHVGKDVANVFLINGLAKEHAQDLQNDLNQLWETLSQNGVTTNDWEFAVSNTLKSVRKEHGRSVVSVVKNIAHNVVLNRNPLWDGDNLAVLNDLSAHPPTPEEVAAYCGAFRSAPTPIVVLENNSQLLAQWDEVEAKTVAQMVKEGRPAQNKVYTQPTNVELLPLLDQKDVQFPERVSNTLLQVPSSPEALAQTLVDAPNAPNLSFGLMYDLGGVELSLHEQMVLLMWSRVATRLGTPTKTYEEQGSVENKRGVGVNWSFGHDCNLDQVVGLSLNLTANSLVENADDSAAALVERSQGAPMLEVEYWQNVFGSVIESIKQKIPDSIVNQSKNSALAPYNENYALQDQLNTYVMENRLAWLEKAVENPAFAQKEFASVLSKAFAAPRHLTAVGPLEHTQNLAGSLAKKCNGAKWERFEDFIPVHAVVPAAGGSMRYPAALMINHCTRAFPGPKWNTKDAAAVKVALKMIEPKLHEVVREHGGAYGVYAALSAMTITLRSYRDPWVDQTFEAFSRLPEFLDEVVAKRDPQALNEAKLSMFKQFLVPQSSFAKASSELNMLGTGYSREEDARAIERIRDVDWNDIVRVSKKWLNPDPSIITDSAAVAQNKYTAHSKMS